MSARCSRAARPPRLLLCLALLLGPVSACTPEPPLDVVIVTLDTTRADMLGSYGGPGRTPFLDSLAAEAALYEQAITTAPYTGPSHASLMTGLHPARHGLRDFLGQALPEHNRTLAEVLRDAGWTTAAFVSAYVLDPRWGLAQGFQHYSSPRPRPDSSREHRHQRPASETFDRAIEWLRAQPREAPIFLWLHSYDAHAHITPEGPVYRPPPDLARPLPAGMEARSVAAQRRRYYEQSAGLDRQVERAIAALRELGRWERTLLVVTADHGELLGHHGRKLGTHSPSLSDATLRVPLLVRMPGGRLAPGTRARQVSLVDLYPTVLDAVGLPVPAELPGHSLLEAGPERPAYSETLYAHHPRLAEPGEELMSLRHQGWKLIVGPDREELYDLRSDPDELRNRADEEPERLRAMRARLDELRRGWPAEGRARPLALPPAERDDHEARLRALGYVE